MATSFEISHSIFEGFAPPASVFSGRHCTTTCALYHIPSYAIFIERLPAGMRQMLQVVMRFQVFVIPPTPIALQLPPNSPRYTRSTHTLRQIRGYLQNRSLVFLQNRFHKPGMAHPSWHRWDGLWLMSYRPLKHFSYREP